MMLEIIRRDLYDRAAERLLNYPGFLESERGPQADIPAIGQYETRGVESAIRALNIIQASDGKLVFIE